MGKWEKIMPPAECQRLHVSRKELLGIEKGEHLRMLFLIHLIREFENTVLDLKDEDLVHGPAHISIGQEANAAAVGVALKRSDMVGSTHRAHGHFLAKAIMYHAPTNFDPLKDDVTEDMQRAVNKTLAEIMGLKDGWCAGRGGSMHLYDAVSGNIGSNAIVGGGIPLSTGAAWAEKLKKSKGIVVSFFGDGAINQGCFHEVANMASLWGLPIIYFVENNLYAVGTSTCVSSSCIHLGLRSLSYGIDSMIVDGMDPVAVYHAMHSVDSKIRKGHGPFFIESETYRFHHHAGRLAGSPFGYRSKEEETEWQSKDPLTVYVNSLIEEKIITAKDNQNIGSTARASVEEALGFCTDHKKGKRYIPMDKWPLKEDAVRFVRSEGSRADDLDYVELEDFSAFSNITYVEAIAGVTLRNMERDPNMFVLGEEVANLHGGAYQATKGIKEVFPERLINTPISECGFVGMAGGAAANGMHPVVEIMFPDFALVACDQLFNQIGKLKYMYGNQVSFPLLVRTRVAIGQGYGGQHSMSPAGLFGLFSGWRVIAPSTPFDYVGMFNTAAQLNDPVLIIEHGDLYHQKGPVPTDNMDYCVEYGRAAIVQAGSHVTLLTYLTGVNDALAAARQVESEGIEVEVIDLRTLDYTGMDFETIGASVEKTGHVIVLEQTPRSMGIASRVSDEIQERFFDYLDSPVQKITAPDVPPPVSRMLETALLPDVDKIIEGIFRIRDV